MNSARSAKGMDSMFKWEKKMQFHEQHHTGPKTLVHFFFVALVQKYSSLRLYVHRKNNYEQFSSSKAKIDGYNSINFSFSTDFVTSTIWVNIIYIYFIVNLAMLWIDCA